jgi:hypothetical protein
MAAERKALDEATAQKLLEEFLATGEDVPTVHEVDQGMELHVTGTDAYVTSFTRQQWDKAFGGPVQAVKTRTNKASKTVYIYAADDPEERNARKLRCDDISGPAFFAFGVPLRQLGITVPEERRVILPLQSLQAEGRTVWCVSFADYEKENRQLEAAGQAGAASTAQGQKPGPRKKGQEATPAGAGDKGTPSTPAKA